MLNPQEIGGYSILSKIGSGGFGTVHRAYDPDSGRAVAIKTLNSQRADSDAIERFRREALLTSEMDHPNVIGILDGGKDAGVHFIVMEMMPLSLVEMLSAGSLPISRAMDICRQAALGLKSAHDRDVIHRDIKPANILIDSNGVVKVSDFGIAHAGELPSLTATGIVGFGSRGYMSPEQHRDAKRVDARADIYSLGVTLCEMLTGKLYERGESAKASRPVIPDGLERIVNKCTERNRENRYESMDALLQEIANPALVNRCVLIDFYEATGGDNWRRNDNWLTEGPLYNWRGVATYDNEVIQISLISNRLLGSIPTELGNLAKLRRLNLSDNRLSGGIPPELGNLAKLEVLSLRGNRLSGSIPPELGNLAKLKSLFLSGNRLSGSVPSELGNLAKLESLLLSGNRLSGSVPPELGNLAKLKSLFLGYNDFSGSIPPELSDLTELGHLILSGNGLSGSIPKSLFDIPDNDLDKIDLPVCDD